MRDQTRTWNSMALLDDEVFRAPGLIAHVPVPVLEAHLESVDRYAQRVVPAGEHTLPLMQSV